MIALRVLLGAIWVAALVAGTNMWAAGARIDVHPHVSTTTVFGGVAIPRTATDDDGAGARLDLNGNEIDDAISDYRVDGVGDVYERHAPDAITTPLPPPQS